MAGEARVQALATLTMQVRVQVQVVEALVAMPLCTHDHHLVGAAMPASQPRHRLLRKQPLQRRRLRPLLFQGERPCSMHELLQRRSVRRPCAGQRLRAACKFFNMKLKERDSSSPRQCTQVWHAGDR